MMNQISNFLVDFLFYTMIEGFMFYFIYFTYKNLHVSSFICTISDALKFSVLYSFVLCVFSRIFPFGFYQAISIVVFIIITHLFLKESIHTSFFICCEISFSVVIFEMIFVIFMDYFFNFNILSYSFTDSVRVICFIALKIIELLVVLFVRFVRMKFVVGTVTRR